MKDLKCGMRECRYNKGYCCCSKTITVSGMTDCTTFTPDENKRRAEFEAANDFIPANYNVELHIQFGRRLRRDGHHRYGQCAGER